MTSEQPPINREPDMPKAGPGARPAADAPLARAIDLATIEPGWEVYSADGQLLGSVGAVGPNYFLIRGASTYGRDMFIPQQFIETTTNRRVVLSKPKALLLDMKLDEQPIPASVVEAPHQSELMAESAGDPAQLPQTDVGAERPHAPIPEPLRESTPASGRQTRVPPPNIEAGWSVEHIVESSPVYTYQEVEPSGASYELPLGRAPVGATQASLDFGPVDEGWEVFDCDGDSIGKVAEVTRRYLHIKEGLIFKHDRYIPIELVASVDAEHQRLVLTQAKETVDEMDLSQAPIPERELDPSTPHAESPISAHHTAGPYVLDSASRDKPDGPTHQPGTAPHYEPLRGQPTEYAPYRSPQEHDEVDLNLRLNKAPDGDPFGSAEANEGKPIPPGTPSAGNRELPGP